RAHAPSRWPDGLCPATRSSERRPLSSFPLRARISAARSRSPKARTLSASRYRGRPRRRSRSRVRAPEDNQRPCPSPSLRTVPSLLVTNDFPPKLGGIQSYLYELWRRLPPEEITVLTTPYDGTREWDAQQAFRIVRTKEKVLLPTRALTRDVDALA